MEKLTRLSADANAFKFEFDSSLLDEIRESYQCQLAASLASPENLHMLDGGKVILHEFGTSGEYFVISFGSYPLLWFSCNTKACYGIYKRFFDALSLENDIKQLVDHNERIVLYQGFLVIGDRSLQENWHVDYYAGGNAYTLLTPLFDLEQGHGQLLYKTPDEQVEKYSYRLGEAVLVGEELQHSTEPYPRNGNLRILACVQFGTDKLDHWGVLSQTIAQQSRYLILPCGHEVKTCSCLAVHMAQSRISKLKTGAPAS
jgi:hypothetical protein